MTAFALGGLRSRVLNRLRTVTGERVFWTVVVAAAVLFVLFLILEPTGAGRGGR
jgi:hypothetical protein